MRVVAQTSPSLIHQACIIVVQHLMGYYTMSRTGNTVGAGIVPRRYNRQRMKSYTDTAKSALQGTEKFSYQAMDRMQKEILGPIPEGFVETATYVYCPHNMNIDQLTAYVKRCRATHWGNCELQALEAALHLRAVGIDAHVESNKEISHNYVVIKDRFNIETVVDAWGGNEYLLGKCNWEPYQRSSSNIEDVATFDAWIEQAHESILMPELISKLNAAGLIPLKEFFGYNLRRAFAKKGGLGLYP